MILDKISSALAHLEDITPAEMEELPERTRKAINEVKGILNDLLLCRIDRVESPE